MRPSSRVVTLLIPLVLGGAAAAGGAPQIAAAPVAAMQAPPAATSAQNPFLGGVPVGTATGDTLALSLADAVARGLRQNLGFLLGEQAVRLAEAGRWTALSALLPNVTGALRETRERINLEAFGFPLPPGTNPIVGPFNVVDVRASLVQSVFDYSAIKAAQAAAANATAAKFAYQDARDTVVLVVGSLYLQAVAGASRVDAARAQLTTAEAVYRRASALKAAGTVPGIEVLRAQVQMQADEQRVIALENDFAKQKLALARAIGLPLAQAFVLSDALVYTPAPEPSLEQALADAYASRADVQSAAARLRAAEANRRAAFGTTLPSVGIAADFGDIGQTWATAKATYSVSASVRVPIFEGGRARGRMQQADAAFRQQRAELDDLRARVEYEVRAALLDVKAAGDRVRVAQGASDLAAQQLTQAEDRFSAGVSSNIEVVQAQQAVATATENYVSSLYAYNAAKLALARATGLAEEHLDRLLGGIK